jgi:hypothetical protein
MGNAQNFHEFTNLISLGIQCYAVISTFRFNKKLNFFIFYVSNCSCIILTRPLLLLIFNMRILFFFFVSFIINQLVFSLFRLSLLKFWQIPIKLVPNQHILKLHNIASQSSSFIRENIANLPQIFNNTGSLAFDKFVSFPRKHQSILLNIKCLN